MKLIITLNLDNAAFNWHEQSHQLNGFEIARILRSLADRYDGTIYPQELTRNLYDTNGNQIGKAQFTKDALL